MTTIYIRTNEPLPAREINDVYETEPSLIRAVAEYHNSRLTPRPKNILDVGAGDGRWGKIFADTIAAPCDLWGVEYRDIPKPQGYAHWAYGQDFLTWNTDTLFDLIVSNPPYKFAEEMVRRSWDMLAKNGEMYFLFRTSFAEGVGRYHGLFSEMPPVEQLVLSRRPSFSGNGKTNATSFSVFRWAKSEVVTPRTWTTKLLLHERS